MRETTTSQHRGSWCDRSFEQACAEKPAQVSCSSVLQAQRLRRTVSLQRREDEVLPRSTRYTEEQHIPQRLGLALEEVDRGPSGAFDRQPPALRCRLCCYGEAVERAGQQEQHAPEVEQRHELVGGRAVELVHAVLRRVGEAIQALCHTRTFQIRMRK